MIYSLTSCLISDEGFLLALQWAFVRNWFMRLAYPVHSFLKPAAFWPGSLEPGSAIIAAQPQNPEILQAVNAMLVQPQAVAAA